MMQLTQWEKYYPDIGANRAAPKEKRVFLEVERGLTTKQRDAFQRALQSAIDGEPEGLVGRLTEVLATHVRFGSEPLTWEGGTVTMLGQYLELVFVELRNPRYMHEALGLVVQANTFTPSDALFFERPSGTEPGTTEGLRARAV